MRIPDVPIPGARTMGPVRETKIPPEIKKGRVPLRASALAFEKERIAKLDQRSEPAAAAAEAAPAAAASARAGTIGPGPRLVDHQGPALGEYLCMRHWR